MGKPPLCQMDIYPGSVSVSLRKMRPAAAPAPMLKVWFMELRAPFFTAVIAPTMLGSAIAWYEKGAFNSWLFVLTLVGVIFVHAGTNVVNDYFDFRGGTDRINRNKSPFNGGSPFITEGILKPESVYRAALAFFAIGGAIGLYLAYEVSYAIAVMGFAGAGFGYFYTAPRVNLAARGVGELAVGAGFGPLIVGGAYTVQTGDVSLLVFLAGLPVGLLIGLVLFINQFPDMEADGATGKTHWVVRMGRRTAASWYVCLLLLSFFLIPVLWIAGVSPTWTLLGLVPGFIALRAARIVLAKYDQVRELVPAQAMTIQMHLLVGLLLTAGYVLSAYI